MLCPQNTIARLYIFVCQNTTRIPIGLLGIGQVRPTPLPPNRLLQNLVSVGYDKLPFHERYGLLPCADFRRYDKRSTELRAEIFLRMQ